MANSHCHSASRSKRNQPGSLVVDRADFAQSVGNCLIDCRQVPCQILMMSRRIKVVDILRNLSRESIHKVVVLHREADHLKQACAARLYEKEVVNIPVEERRDAYLRALDDCHDFCRHAARHTRELFSDDSYRSRSLHLH